MRVIGHFGTRMHALLYRASAGRVLGRMGGQPVLLLETTGRRSGEPHTTPLQCLPRAWRELTAANRWLERAAKKAGRELPVVVLEPVD